MDVRCPINLLSYLYKKAAYNCNNKPQKHVAYSASNTYMRCYISVASLQHLYTSLTNAYICVAIEPCNATFSNTYNMRWYRS